MRVIVILGKKNKKKTHLMLDVPDKKTIEIKELLNTLKLPEAISRVMSMGKSVKKLTGEELVRTTSDLILTNTNAYWNLLVG